MDDPLFLQVKEAQPLGAPAPPRPQPATATRAGGWSRASGSCRPPSDVLLGWDPDQGSRPGRSATSTYASSGTGSSRSRRELRRRRLRALRRAMRHDARPGPRAHRRPGGDRRLSRQQRLLRQRARALRRVVRRHERERPPGARRGDPKREAGGRHRRPIGSAIRCGGSPSRSRSRSRCSRRPSPRPPRVSASSGCRASTRPGTPAKYDKVGILKIGPPKRAQRPRAEPRARRPAPRTSCRWRRRSSAQAKRWQVWSVERRENLLEDHSVFNQAKAGQATAQQVFDYYLGWLDRPSITDALPARSRTPTSRSPASGACASRSRTCAGSCKAAERAGRPRRASAAIRSAARSPPPMPPGTSPARRARAGCRASFHRRRQRPDADHAEADARQSLTTLAHAPRPGSPSAASPPRSPACSTPPARWASLHRPRHALARPGVAAAAGEPEAAGPGHEPRPVRLRARHRDLASGLAAAQAHLGHLAASGRSARLGRRRRAHAARAASRACSRAGG